MERGIESKVDGGPYLTPEEEERQAAWYEAHRRELYRQLGLRRFARILEVGCGSGVVTAELARRAARGAVGVDRRVDVLRAAEPRGGGRGLRVRREATVGTGAAADGYLCEPP